MLAQSAQERDSPHLQRKTAGARRALCLRISLTLLHYRPRAYGSRVRECLDFPLRGKDRFQERLASAACAVKNVGSPLLIIADDVGGEVLATLVVNKLRGLLQVAAVRVPGFGEQRARIFREIAQITGAKSIAEGNEMQLNRLQISDLGLARKIHRL